MLKITNREQMNKKATCYFHLTVHKECHNISGASVPEMVVDYGGAKMKKLGNNITELCPSELTCYAFKA